MIVKVCGMTQAENIKAVEEAGADWMGFICYGRSPRRLADIPEYLPDIHRVGVFVDAGYKDIMYKVHDLGLDTVQLHGSELPSLCHRLQEEGLTVVKVFSLRTRADLAQTVLYGTCCDYFLFDTPCAGYGGSGKTFDWSLLEAYHGDVPFLLSGGISPESIEALSAFRHPQWAGIDLNSGFEISPGLKDAEKLRAFINQFKELPTMNRINQLFQNKKHNVLSIYFCAGTPLLDETHHVIHALEQAGVDMVEIGIPFSDPMADGPVIQTAATQALRNGMTLRKLFAQLADIRKDVHIPLILMGYLNPIMHYGFEAFCQKCQECGIDGVIVPDLPFKDYERDFRPIADRYGIKIIMLITPETSEPRIRQIDEHTDGFIYMVSSAAITGAQKDFNEQKQAYFRRIEAMNLKNPRMIGFGISNKQTYEAAAAHAAGCIIGSKFVSLLEEEKGKPEPAIQRLLQLLKE